MRKGLSKPRFEAVFQGGKRVSTRHFRLSATFGEGRVGIATSKKIGCHARRNWVKRRIRAILLRLDDVLRTDLDYIFVASATSVNAEWGEMGSEIDDALSRMNERWAAESESS
ncbi:MAG: ribonuclease P protein component [Armatimonadetes bacterium]|nr:ribonuclease P protein component [Armatimonadota bacterium]